jgi:hypothetical protein
LFLQVAVGILDPKNSSHMCAQKHLRAPCSVSWQEAATLDALEGGLLLLEPMLLEYLALMTLAILLSEPNFVLLVG